MILEKMWITIFLLRIEFTILWHDSFRKMFIALMTLNKTKKKTLQYGRGLSQSNVFFCFVQVLSLDEMIFIKVKEKNCLQDERASFNTSCCTVFIEAVSLARWYVIAAVIGFLKWRHNIPPFPKAASEVGVNMWRDVKHEVGLWTVNN